MELPRRVEVRIQSKLANQLVSWCEGLALLLPMDCAGMERSLAVAAIPMPEPGGEYLLTDAELTPEDRGCSTPTWGARAPARACLEGAGPALPTDRRPAAGDRRRVAAETALGGSTWDRRPRCTSAPTSSALVLAGQWWRLFTAMFLHIGLVHLLLNGYALYQLGGLFESWMGSARMGVVYVLSGLAGLVAEPLLPAARTVGRSLGRDLRAAGGSRRGPAQAP